MVKIIASFAEPAPHKQPCFAPVIDASAIAVQQIGDFAHRQPSFGFQAGSQTPEVVIAPQAVDDAQSKCTSAAGAPSTIIEQTGDLTVGVPLREDGDFERTRLFEPGRELV